MDDMLTDDALVARTQSDAEAFSILYRRHLHRVYSYLLSRVGDVQDAQDLTAQTFIAALSTIKAYQSTKGLFIAWLLGIAKHKAADHFRNHVATLSLDDVSTQSQAQDTLEEDVIRQLQMEQISAIFAKINPERAEALRLRYFAHLKFREVAAVMNKSEASVKMLVARGLDDIRHILGTEKALS